MSKRRGVRGPWIPREGNRPPGRAGKQKPQGPAAILESTRREFVKRVSAAAMALGVPPLFGQTSREEIVLSEGNRRGRTLFFNFSHMQGTDTEHFLYMAGRKYRLSRIAENPKVLAQERSKNEFLRTLHDEHITHHVRGVQVPDGVTLAYSTCSENTTPGSPGFGTWAMTAMHFHFPQSAVSHAYAKARERTPSGPLPLSGKRRRYGVRPATTEQDFLDEMVFVDFNSHAEAMVGLHPDILSLEPMSGANIINNYVGPSSDTQALASDLEEMGPAVPESMTSVNGAQPWATLDLLGIDPNTSQPFKKTDGKLNQYQPDWNSTVDGDVTTALGGIHPTVRGDTTLGVDVTGLNLNDNVNNPVPPEQLTGRLWARHDGTPTVEVAVGAAGGTGPVVTFTNQGAETGLKVTEPKITILPDGRVQVTLDNVSNWFLRWLGMWVQFVKIDGTVIPAADLPPDTYPKEPGPYPRSGVDDPNLLFLGVVAPAFTIMAIPVYPGSFSPTINIPTSAHTMRILYTGFGLSGSAISDQPSDIYTPGCLMTMAFNYGVVGLFMAAGTSTYSLIFKKVVTYGGGIVAAAIQTIVGAVTNQSDFATALPGFVRNFVRIFIQKGITGILVSVIEDVTVALVAANWIDSIPVAGQIARAVSAAAGAASLLETSIEVDISPPAYIFDVVQTHDLSININPDPTDTQFPVAAGHTLYYKVSYLFDNGTAHTRGEVTVLDPTIKPIAVTFPGVPRGGMVNISTGFYFRKSTTPPGQNDWCAGFGTTGLISNIPDQAPDLAIKAHKIAIQSTTQYLHTHKTVLDADGQNHFWHATPNAPPYTPPPRGQRSGLGDFNSITVRQGTSNPPQQGYIGYAWTAFSTDVNGCNGPAPGQFDQMANVNTDTGNQGANAQNGYINSVGLCGFRNGVRMGYHLLTHNALNMYLDTKFRLIRQVRLDQVGSLPAGFDGPNSGRSFGMLNMDSDRCLLHPSGHIVSINGANNKIETLKLPLEAQTDDVAKGFFLARKVSGFGTRPGLMDTPVAAAISPDGAILVLERGNNRIQAFDLGGNPVQFFNGQADKYFLKLEATHGFTYLDLAVEFTGYLYVLSKDSNNNHRLDIYHPGQSGTTPICTTQGVNAAKIAVDFWRRAYTLNYEVLQMPGDGIPGFTEPSVSQWLPTPPDES